MTDLIQRLHGRLIVSCQAYPGEPMRDPQTMARIAQACVEGGAAAVRAQGLDDIRAIRAAVDVTLIGLVKIGAEGVFITPTLEDARAVADAGADVVAVDGTRRPRPDGCSLADVVAGLARHAPDVLVMADCGSFDDARAAEAAGVHLLGTTLSGYTGERPKTEGPDLDLATQIAAACQRSLVVEGRVHTPAHVAAALSAGGHAVCVGTAITHPTTITGWFVDALDTRDHPVQAGHALQAPATRGPGLRPRRGRSQRARRWRRTAVAIRIWAATRTVIPMGRRKERPSRPSPQPDVV